MAVRAGGNSGHWSQLGLGWAVTAGDRSGLVWTGGVAGTDIYLRGNIGITIAYFG